MIDVMIPDEGWKRVLPLTPDEEAEFAAMGVSAQMVYETHWSDAWALPDFSLLADLNPEKA